MLLEIKRPLRSPTVGRRYRFMGIGGMVAPG